MLPLLSMIVPSFAGLIAALTPWRRWVGWSGAGSLVAVLGIAIALAIKVVRNGPVVCFSGVLRVDALSAFMMIVVGAVGTLATVQGVRYLTNEIEQGRCSVRHASLYAVLVQGFISTMLLAIVAGNVGVMWVAIEATTIITTFLVGHRRTRGALEASWKYVIICSVGIAIAFLGTVLIYLAALHVGHQSSASLNWTALMAIAPHMNPGVVRIAISLLVLGYGTKVGLAPMHSWLPDAHSQAPAPVSALMSGVLLSVAFYAILRFKSVADAALGPAFPRGLLLAAGLLTLLVATSLLIRQRDYKRMFAYSSMEHMGLLALGAAAGTPLAISAVLLHVIGHGLTKAVLFLTSGELLVVEGTSDIDQVRALIQRRPALGAIFAFGLVALLGIPPFSLFVSEYTLLRAQVNAGLTWVVVVTLLCLAVIFASMLSHGSRMLLGERRGDEPVHRTSAAVTIPLGSALAACAAIGMLAWPLATLVHAASTVVT